MKPVIDALIKILFVGITCINLRITVAAEIPWASSPEEVGMSAQRLEQIDTVMQRHIEAGDIQGAVTAVARRGKLVHFKAHGLMDVEGNRPMLELSLIHI